MDREFLISRQKLGDLFLALVALLCIAAAIFSLSNKVSFLTVTTRSMEPAIRAGDIVVTKAIARDIVQKSDVVVLPLPQNPEIFYTHRVIKVTKADNQIVVNTKGDANPIPDAWSLQITSSTIPKEIAVLPTSWIFTGPISRSVIVNLLLISGLMLAFIGVIGLVKRRNHESV